MAVCGHVWYTGIGTARHVCGEKGTHPVHVCKDKNCGEVKDNV